MRRSAALVLLGLSSLGCSWSRFDDVTKNEPIVLLHKPKELSNGFGSSLATATVDANATLLVGGAPLASGGAEYDLGKGEDPATEAIDTGHCLGSDVQCYFSQTPVALARAKGPGNKPKDLCFVDGAGVASGDRGLVVRCTDAVEYALAIPSEAEGLLDFSITMAQPTMFRFGADRGPDPALLATGDESKSVWFYPSLSRDFVDIPHPANRKGQWALSNDAVERSLAVARIGDAGRLLAVGTPSLAEVRLFYAPDGQTPSYIGCLGGTSKFGRAMATGPIVAGNKDDDLVISDASLVYVLDGAKLATLRPTTQTDCTLGSLPEQTLITSFSCGSTKNISGCDSSDFGAALAVGDLDGDGDGEVVVGAPSMTVRHTSRAGAVLIYDVEADKTTNLWDLKDIAFLSSADQDDNLGAAIALPDLGDRQLLAAGAPGGGKVALFYCPSFLPPELKGARCQ